MNAVLEFQKKYSLTPKDLIEILQKSRSSIKRYKTGKQTITKDVLFRIEKYQEEHSQDKSVVKKVIRAAIEKRISKSKKEQNYE